MRRPFMSDRSGRSSSTRKAARSTMSGRRCSTRSAQRSPGSTPPVNWDRCSAISILAVATSPSAWSADALPAARPQAGSRSMPEVLVDNSGAVRRLMLNRPDKRNARDHRTIEALLSEFERAQRDEAVNVVVLAGAGTGFSAGADLREASGVKDPRAIAHHAELMSRLLLAPWQLRKPVIAEVHGFALGAGFGLTLSCDMALCSDDAVLSFPEIRHGML